MELRGKLQVKRGDTLSFLLRDSRNFTLTDLFDFNLIKAEIPIHFDDEAFE